MSTTPAAADLPEVEQIWVVEATYADNAAELRPTYRAEHLNRVVELKATGRVVEAGAYGDLSCSLLLVRASTEQEVLDLCRADVYFDNGVWTELRARPFGRVV